MIRKKMIVSSAKVMNGWNAEREIILIPVRTAAYVLFAYVFPPKWCCLESDTTERPSALSFAPGRV